MIKIKGRIASLLEVGTGFHTELTGRENIYLNGSINGMDRNEVTKKLNEIIEFAGVEKFIDTPVKRYSSGMYVRLGFAVAAHLDPDVLIVDEVLAVGDIEFQKKAIGKMKDVSSSLGRTVLFVSHKMPSIRNLCSRVILFDKGKIIEDGQPEKVINTYIGKGKSKSVAEKIFSDPSKTNRPKGLIPGEPVVKLYSVRLLNEKEKVSIQYNIRENIFVEIKYKIPEGIINLNILLYLSGIYNSKCLFPKDLLNDDQYFITLIMHENKSFHIREKNIISFTVIDDMDINGARGGWVPGKKWRVSSVRPKLTWINTKES